MVLGKKVAIFDWNGAEIRPLEKGRKSPAILFFIKHPTLSNHFVTQFEVTNAFVHCTDGIAGHFATECLSNIYIFEAIRAICFENRTHSPEVTFVL